MSETPAPGSPPATQSPTLPPLREADGFDRQLIAEIRILADYVSSRGDTGLATGSAGKLPPSTGSYADALSRYFDIFTTASATRMLSADDRGFLTLFRDYLADAACPATSSTIAFSTLTSEVEKAHAARSEPTGGVFVAIKEAFPLYADLARSFRSQIKWIGRGAVALTVLVAVASGYVFVGNQFLTHLGDLEAQAAKLWQDRANEEQVQDAMLTSASSDMRTDPTAAPHARECSILLPAQGNMQARIVKYTVETQDTVARVDFLVHTTIRYAQLCAQLASLARDWQATVTELRLFSWTDGRVLTSDTRPDSRRLDAGAMVALVNGYITPLLMGLLGASAFVMRSYLSALTAKTLHPRDLRAHKIRLGLGVIAGLAVGFFMSPGPALSEQVKGFDTAVSLTGPALAFLAGYAVEVLFGFLDTIARTVFPTPK